MTRLAQLVAKMEGFGLPGVIPTLRNNPGDLRHSPHSTHPPGDPEGIGYIDTVEHGWEDLERQLELDAARGYNIAQFALIYAPYGDGGNDSHKYAQFLAVGLDLPVSALLKDALKIPAIPT